MVVRRYGSQSVIISTFAADVPQEYRR
jgi:hypothetical protein